MKQQLFQLWSSMMRQSSYNLIDTFCQILNTTMAIKNTTMALNTTTAHVQQKLTKTRQDTFCQILNTTTAHVHIHFCWTTYRKSWQKKFTQNKTYYFDPSQFLNVLSSRKVANSNIYIEVCCIEGMVWFSIC